MSYANDDEGMSAPTEQLGNFMNLLADAHLEDVASFGICKYNDRDGTCHLTPASAAYLELVGTTFASLDDCFTHVVQDDLTELIQYVTGPCQDRSAKIEVRVFGSQMGLRWLRMTRMVALSERTHDKYFVLQDVTDAKHARVREKLGFELTEFLTGTHTLEAAITNVIQLICKNLGWDWGAYWSIEGMGAQRLFCRHFWHPDSQDLQKFSAASSTLSMLPGEGLVGQVWETGVAQWVEEMSTDPRFLQQDGARFCGLWSGYVFPVTYVSDDGEQHRPGVLEFYSGLARQPDAQLPKVSAAIGAVIAQTAQRLEIEAEIRRLAQIDELTELDNRAHFYGQLNKQCVLAGRSNAPFALMFIDLDRFKPINDAYGHDAGNVVLRTFAQRLSSLVPSGARVGRLGGDEFAALLPGCSDEVELAELVDQVLAEAVRPIDYEDLKLTVSASIGVSRFPENGRTGPELLRSADAAMYRVKQNGRNGNTVFSNTNPEILAVQRATLANVLAIEAELRQALRNEQLVLAYQPIYELATGQLHGAEALIRWRTADGSMVPPDVFIPIAERSGLIVDIGRWVAGQVFRDLAVLQTTKLAKIKVHVNMAASEFTNANLPNLLGEMALNRAIPSSQLVLELTEGMLMKQPDQVVPIMRRLRQLGFEISLDDFGMGHSSLSMLKNLPLTSLKIDRSFVRDLAKFDNDRAIARTIIDLGRHMGLEVIAEGIESSAQLDILRASGCRLAQGFLLGRPMPLDSLLEAHRDHGDARTNSKICYELL